MSLVPSGRAIRIRVEADPVCTPTDRAVPLGVIVAGRLLDRVPARYLLCCGVFLMGGGLLLIGAAPTLIVAFLGTIVLGLGYGAIDVSPNVVVAALNPES